MGQRVCLYSVTRLSAPERLSLAHHTDTRHAENSNKMNDT